MIKKSDNKLGSRLEISIQQHGANFSMYNYHSHSWYEVFYLTKGQCTFYIDDASYIMEEGDIAIIQPDVPHKTSYTGENNERLCIEFSYDYIQPLIDKLGGELFEKKLFTVLKISSENRVVTDSILNNMMIEKTKNDIVSNTFAFVYFQEFILKLLRGATSVGGYLFNINNAENSMQNALEYIKNNYTGKLTLNDIARQFHLNPSYFSKRFKTVNNIGFKEYLNNLRISHSEKLLLETQKNITEIAFESGFENSNYYGDAFRLKNGVSPSEYRRLKGNIK